MIPLPPDLPFVPLAQAGGGYVVNGLIFAALAGAAIFAVCRSSRRS